MSKAAGSAPAELLVDLTQPLYSGMPVYPGDPEVEITPALTVAADGVNLLRLHLGSQSGTHVDAPAHVRDGLPDLEALPLTRFVGPAVLVDARDAGPRAALPPSVLDPVRDRLSPGTVVLLVTGWSQYWNQPAYLAHPWPSPELAAELVEAGVRTVGIDAPSVDVTPAPADPPVEPVEPADPPVEPVEPADPPVEPVEPVEPGLALPTHLVLATAGCAIAENLTGLEPLLAAQAAGADVRVSLLPLRLTGADGAPVRAVATVRGWTVGRQDR